MMLSLRRGYFQLMARVFQLYAGPRMPRPQRSHWSMTVQDKRPSRTAASLWSQTGLTVMICNEPDSGLKEHSFELIWVGDDLTDTYLFLQQ